MTTRAELQRQANECKSAAVHHRNYAAKLRDQASDLKATAMRYDQFASTNLALAAELERRIDAGEFEGQG